MPSAYPTVGEVQAKCTELGITAPSDVEGILGAVIQDLKRSTGFDPFLADDDDSTCIYDPEWKAKDLTLDLRGGFVSFTSVSIDDVEVDASDYDGMPLSVTTATMAAGGPGWTELRFRGHPGFTLASVEIVGTRGLYAILPYDVYQAILEEAVGRCSMSTSGSSGDIQSVKQGQMTVQYGESDSMGRTGFAKGAAARFDSVVKKYRRMVI